MFRARKNASHPRATLIAAHVAIVVVALSMESAFGQSVLPTGATTVGGTAAIGSAVPNDNGGRSLTINQGSNRAIINWTTFSIGALDQVNIVQQTANAALLNRVTGSQPSTIAGQLTSRLASTGAISGQIYLINPNGIAIANGASINTGAFVASTLDIDGSNQTTRNASFMAAGVPLPGEDRIELTFSGSGSSVSVSADAQITTARGGYVALIGSTVSNAGIITAPAGAVELLSGGSITLNLSGDGFLQIARPNNPLTTAAGTGPLVSNTGIIRASGGLIQLLADEAQNMARQVVNLSGTVDTSGVSGQNGNIVLTSYVSDTAVVARGASQPTTGVVIDATTLANALAGANVTINSGADAINNPAPGQPPVGSIDIAPALSWSGNTKLTLNAAADINLHGDINADRGSLSLSAGGKITSSGAVNLGGTFELASGSWVQNAAVLPGFYARDFKISGGTFLRVIGGDGSGSNPWLLNDIYGLKGISWSNAYRSDQRLLLGQDMTGSGRLYAETGTSSFKTAFFSDRRKSLPSNDTGSSSGTETSRRLIVDPRFDGTEVCLASGGGCMSAPVQAAQ